ncbi:MAG: hypothetical protein WC010_04140 [Candidatus Absconditabacterales bacterium]
MNSEIKETQDVDNKDTLAEMVRSKFGVMRNKFKTTNRSRLAKMADVSEEEYARAQKQDKKKNREYNLKIRNRILNDDMVPLHKDNEVISQFEEGQKTALKESFTETQINAYMNNMPEKEISSLKKLSPDQLVGFVEQEMEGIDEKKQNIQEKMGYKINQETSEQLANLTRLGDLQNRLSRFLLKDKFAEFRINRQTKKFEKSEREEKFQGKLIKCKNQKESYEKLIKIYGSEEGAEAYLRYEYSLDETKKSDSYAQLAPEQKKEFEQILVDTYVMNNELDIDIGAFGFEGLSSDAAEIIVYTYNKNDPYQKLMEKINTDSDINTFFDKDENKTSELVPEKDKNKTYYKKLLQFYPESDIVVDNKKLSEYLQYFDDDMNVKNDVPSDKKNILSSVMQNFKQQQKPYEDKLLHLTNAQTQSTAVEQCVSTLQMYMDVDINEKENITKQLSLADKSDIVSSNLILHVDGKINNKKVQLSYDLATGKVSYKSFLTKKNDQPNSDLYIDSRDDEIETPLVTLPSFGAFVDGAKAINYNEVIEKSSTLDGYGDNFKQKLQQSIKFNNKEDASIKKDILKKVIIKDMITQSIIGLTGRGEEGKQNLDYTITASSQPNTYAFYNYLYKSLEFYSMRGITQLQTFQNSITTLVDFRERMKTKSIDGVMSHEGTNQEMFVLQAMSNQAVIPSVTDRLKDQGPEESLLGFFKCFEKSIGGVAIIDVQMMDDYFKAATGTNKENNTVGKWKRNESFKSIVNNLDNKLSTNKADQDLDSQLQKV